MPKFDKRNPNGKEQKLIIELASDLMSVTKAFITLNKLDTDDHTLFLVLRDGSMAAAGQIIGFLAEMLARKESVPKFTDEARRIFDCYLKQINYEASKEKI